jgi:dipeptidyl aminopeptidase/acylaminoacyl peptidase
MTKMIFQRSVLALFVVLLSGIQTAVSQGVTVDDIARMQTVTSSLISEDGKYIAYTLSVPADPVKENLPATNHLYVLNTQTGISKPYYTTASVSQLAFRPQKNTLTFVSRKSGENTNGIFELDLTGGEAVKIFSFTSNISGYNWHPNGNKIAFNTLERGTAPVSNLAYKPDFYEENIGERKAYIVDVTHPTNVQPILAEGSVYRHVWSPDGSKLAISVTPTASVDDSYMKQAVKIVDATSGKIIASVNNQGKLSSIHWSPDGSRLALLAAKDIHDPIDGSILIVSAQGGTPQIIDADVAGKYEQIYWTDNQTISYRMSESTSSSIGTIRPDGSQRKVIFKSDTHAITSFSKSGGNLYSFVASTPEHPAEVYTLEDGRKVNVTKRTDNNTWLASRKLGKQEVITYKTRDGQYEIDGMLIYPVNYQAGTRVPVITVVHGGPEAHYSNGWLTAYSMPGQMAAARGYAVFYPNYRGSTGRGTAFTYSSQGDMAGKEFDDIVDGIDYLIAQGIADKNRIGVTGGSYGGYASAWMSTYYSDRFAAAVMFVGISNNLSKWGTSDIPDELYYVHARERIWDNWQGMLERSPIYYVDRSQTPILIMHGAEDTRVHPAQSMELYRHLKVRKPEVPVRLIYYPNEGHGNIRSGSRYDYNLRMLQWFDTYLKTGDRTATMPSLDLPKLD